MPWDCAARDDWDHDWGVGAEVYLPRDTCRVSGGDAVTLSLLCGNRYLELTVRLHEWWRGRRRRAVPRMPGRGPKWGSKPEQTGRHAERRAERRAGRRA